MIHCARIVAGALAVLFVGILCQLQARAQMGPLTGVDGPFARRSTSYVGPGDIIASATAWWGLRCYTTAYVGNVADIYAPLDASHTLLTCSAGGVLNETLQALATTCAVSCTVKTLYDQSGALACTPSTACDAAQATEANRPTFIVSCTGGKPCLRGSGSQSLTTLGLQNPLAQPNFVAAVANRTGNTSGNSGIFGDTNANAAFDFNASVNTVLLYAGSALTATAADNAFHTLQYTLNGASSEIIVNGGTPVTGAAGAGVMSSSLSLFLDGFGNFLTGDITEVGLWVSAPSSTPKATLNSNQRAYWGF